VVSFSDWSAVGCTLGRSSGIACVVSVVLSEVLGARQVERGRVSGHCRGVTGWSELSGVALISVVRSVVVPPAGSGSVLESFSGQACPG
jgi:hypothetical protein